MSLVQKQWIQIEKIKGRKQKETKFGNTIGLGIDKWIKKKKGKGLFLFCRRNVHSTFYCHLKWLARSMCGKGEVVHTVSKTKNPCWKATLNILIELKFTILQNILLNNLQQWMIQTWMLFVEKTWLFCSSPLRSS